MPGPQKTDVLLVGTGIMSATLGALLRRVQPDWSITMVERLDAAAAESTDPWNNAGTGHAGLCELFYPPEKAVRINEQFQVTRQFWAYAVERGLLGPGRDFVRPVPHVSVVSGGRAVEQLRRRHAELTAGPLFAGMEFIDDFAEFATRLPLMADGRDPRTPIGLTWTPAGTDVDFGVLAKRLIGYGVRTGTAVLFGHQVCGLSRERRGWTVRLRNRRTGDRHRLTARFVFVGAGGGALPLLQRSGIAEVRGYGGFPIGGQFLRCAEPRLVAGHRAKVYGTPAPGAPATTAPHLDLRVVNDRPWLLFGPFAAWSPRFLKHGRATDLPGSIRPDNLRSLLRAGFRERGLMRYLLDQLRRPPSARVDALRAFVPTAARRDWAKVIAGQRVQVIRGGELQFETTVVSAADGSIAGLLGASPGASVAVSAMLDVLARCFPDRYPGWLPALTEMVPSLGTPLAEQPALLDEVSSWSARVLGLDRPESAFRSTVTR